MIELNNIQRIYFIGIGGIGMSAIARYFHAEGVYVSGYDKTTTSLTKQMESEGIHIHYDDAVNLADHHAQLVVYTPAVPKDHKELNYYRDNNYTVVKRSDVLEMITAESFTICIAGTHGKTTISTLVAHILRDSGYGCTAFLGGIAVNYSTNFWNSNNNVCVVEADEYDRSFLKLQPDIAIITAMDADHLDIYGTEESMQQAFIEFCGKIKSNGLLVSKFGLQKTPDLKAANVVRYSLQNNSADAYAANIKMKHGGYQFDVVTKDWMIDNVRLYMGGMHNVENAVAAITIAHQLAIDNDKIRAALKNFKGIKRRFEYIIAPGAIHDPSAQEMKGEKVPSGETYLPPHPVESTGGEVIYIDDYAHHPEELKALITGAKSLFKGMKCTIVFQPHLYSRTRDLAEEFAASLDLADEIILLPIYPARELPIEGVSSELIIEKMHNRHKQVLSKEEVLKWLQEPAHRLKEGTGLFITAGAGDIDTMVEQVKNILKPESKSQNFA